MGRNSSSRDSFASGTQWKKADSGVIEEFVGNRNRCSK